MHSLSLPLLICGIGAAAMLLSSAIFLLKNTQVVGQVGFESDKQDIFKIIMTVNGLTRDSGDVITFVTISGLSKSKLFDDHTPYLNSKTSNPDGQGYIEYISTFPNMTIKAGEQYKACALLIKDLNLTCQTGNNLPAALQDFSGFYESYLMNWTKIPVLINL